MWKSKKGKRKYTWNINYSDTNWNTIKAKITITEMTKRTAKKEHGREWLNGCDRKETEDRLKRENIKRGRQKKKINGDFFF